MLSQAFVDAAVRAWLIGGNAVELVCDVDLRDHDDIDLFIRADDGPTAAALLENRGFVLAHGSFESGNVFFARDDLVIDLVPVHEHPPRTLGRLAGIEWPDDLLAEWFVGHDDARIRTLRPAMHRRMKTIVADFFDIAPRPKDRRDMAALDGLLR